MLHVPLVNYSFTLHIQMHTCTLYMHLYMYMYMYMLATRTSNMGKQEYLYTNILCIVYRDILLAYVYMYMCVWGGREGYVCTAYYQ